MVCFFAMCVHVYVCPLHFLCIQQQQKNCTDCCNSLHSIASLQSQLFALVVFWGFCNSFWRTVEEFTVYTWIVPKCKRNYRHKARRMSLNPPKMCDAKSISILYVCMHVVLVYIGVYSVSSHTTQRWLENEVVSRVIQIEKDTKRKQQLVSYFR